MAEDHGHSEGGGGGGGDDHGGGHKPHKSHGPPHGGGHEEHAGAPEWLISFADNVALLMGFFVILLAMNMSPKKESGGPGGDKAGTRPNDAMEEFTPAEANNIEFQMSIRKAFHNAPRADSKDPAERKFAADYAKIMEQKSKRKGVEGESPTKQSTPNGTEVTANLTVEFDEGSTMLSLNSKRAIAAVVAKELRDKDWVIEVRGHVSAVEAKAAERAALNAVGADGQDVASDAALFPGGAAGGTGAGFQLSYQRAYTVAQEVARNGVPWRMLRVVACSDMDRAVARVDGDPTKNRKNQRVEIIQSKDRAPPDPASQQPGLTQH